MNDKNMTGNRRFPILIIIINVLLVLGILAGMIFEGLMAAIIGTLIVLSSGTQPAALKDNVCSPGGTTIEAVAELEKSGFRNAIMEAMRVCAEKSRKMSR